MASQQQREEVPAVVVLLYGVTVPHELGNIGSAAAPRRELELHERPPIAPKYYLSAPPGRAKKRQRQIIAETAGFFSGPRRISRRGQGEV